MIHNILESLESIGFVEYRSNPREHPKTSQDSIDPQLCNFLVTTPGLLIKDKPSPLVFRVNTQQSLSPATAKKFSLAGLNERYRISNETGFLDKTLKLF